MIQTRPSASSWSSVEMKSVFFLASVVLVATFCCAEGDRENWIDPHDMLNRKTAPKPSLKKPAEKTIPTEAASPKEEGDQGDIPSLQSKLSQCEDRNKALSSAQRLHAHTCSVQDSNYDTPHFKKIARTFLETAESIGNRTVSFGLKPHEVETLKAFVNSEEGNVHDAREVIVNVLSGVKAEHSGYMQDMLSSTYLDNLNKHTIMISIAIVVTIVLFIVLETSTGVSWRRQFYFVIGICIISSIPWEWYRMYRSALATKQSEMMKDIPKHCQTDHQLGLVESLSLLLTRSFSFSEDSCVKYQESLIVDPLCEVSPVRALSVTITVFLVQPLEYVAEAAGKSFRALFREVPLQWQLPVFLAVMVFVILVLFLISGVQVRFPFVTFGTGSILDQNAMEQLAINKKLLQGIEAVRKMQEGQLKQLTQKAVGAKGACMPPENEYVAHGEEEHCPVGRVPVQDIPALHQ